jgi:hypothetical protein
MIANGCPVDARCQDDQGDTPLLWLCRQPHLDIDTMRMLVGLGASVHARGASGNTGHDVRRYLSSSVSSWIHSFSHTISYIYSHLSLYIYIYVCVLILLYACLGRKCFESQSILIIIIIIIISRVLIILYVSTQDKTF